MISVKGNKMTTAHRTGRGGPRPNSGRKPTLGDNERKNARLPTDLIQLATITGKGNFSDGVRALLQVARHVLMQPGNEPPAIHDEQPVKYCVTADNRSVLAYFDALRMGWLSTGGAGHEPEPVDVLWWCNVPMTPDEVETLLAE